jgi:chromosome segregation ATPase
MSNDGERHGTSDDDNEDDYDTRCSEYIIALRQELTAIKADLVATQQCRHREKVQLDVLRAEQRRLQQHLEKFQARLRLERQVEQLQEKVARQQEQLKLAQSSAKHATCKAPPDISTPTIGLHETPVVDGAELASFVIAPEPKAPARRLRRVDIV